MEHVDTIIGAAGSLYALYLRFYVPWRMRRAIAELARRAPELVQTWNEGVAKLEAADRELLKVSHP